ncbi:hypothetical protein SAMN05216464_10298 [Mucilaginibacter pineti]|uniref:Oligosaccharide repeat unit polymerase n=1 Tax=Mucilaginibacter pineti TaxID=1391627 RepID=A0A1G6W8J8_9SPHI|nr:hypothetical protein [Mucilaginibacter pineti]SDD62270.1 hypothetical protein SAMN05216464_10298 [Mucilaginibacter pineti]
MNSISTVDSKNQVVLNKKNKRSFTQTKLYDSITNKWSLSFLIAITIPGWFFAYFLDSVIVADISSAFASFLLISWFWSRIGRPVEMIRLGRLGAASLCTTQNIAWLLASYIHRTSGLSIRETLGNSPIGRCQLTSYALAMCFISLFSLVLAFLSTNAKINKLEKKLFNLLSEIRNINIQRIELIIFIVVIIEVALVASGIIGQRALVVEGLAKGEEPSWIPLYQSMLPVQVLLNSLLIAKLSAPEKTAKSKRVWLIAIVSILMITFLCFTRGRGSLIFSIVSHGYWFAFFTGKRPRILRLVIIIAVVYPILSQILLFNNFVRSSDSGLSNFKGSVIEILPQALAKYESSSALRAAASDKTTANLASRPLLAMPLAICMQFPRPQFSYGENLRNSAIWAIPGPLFPNKKDYPVQEGLLYKYFPIGDVDVADSIYLTSYTEFSWAGILIYPLLIYCLWNLVLTIIASVNLRGLFTVILFAVFFELYLLAISQGAVTNWFLWLRTFLFWLVMAVLAKIIFPKTFYSLSKNKKQLIS